MTRLELGLAGHVEAWKASRWAAKLEQLKQRNDALADGMAAAVRRLAASEDGAHEAQLRCEMTEVCTATHSCMVRCDVAEPGSSAEAARLWGCIEDSCLKYGLNRRLLLLLSAGCAAAAVPRSV